MNVIDTSIKEVKIIEPKIFNDSRGFFFESYTVNNFADNVEKDIHFVQDNHSKSTRNVLRGLHYQIQKTQGKLVRVIAGEIFDVAVDIRRGSRTFKKWVSVKLSASNKRQLWVPVGFAHGFVVLSNEAEILYKATDFYAPEYERCIIWNDPDIAIEWPFEGNPILSEKDVRGELLNDSEIFG